MNRADVIVIGAGPAGSITAQRLARGGISVLLLDQASFPRDKSCGDGVGAQGLNGLESATLFAYLLLNDTPQRNMLNPVFLMKFLW